MKQPAVLPPVQAPELHRSFQGKCANNDGVGGEEVWDLVGWEAGPRPAVTCGCVEGGPRLVGTMKGGKSGKESLRGWGRPWDAWPSPPPRNPVLHITTSGTAEVGVVK